MRHLIFSYLLIALFAISLPNYGQTDADIVQPDFVQTDADIVQPDLLQTDADIVQPDFVQTDSDIIQPDLLHTVKAPNCGDINAEEFWTEVGKQFFNISYNPETQQIEKGAIPRHFFANILHRADTGVSVFVCDGSDGKLVYFCKNEMPEQTWRDIASSFPLIE